ncbi:hypothetical protein HII31_07099 [Pseudocercospora fuligena]|uniref:F-box domain-containing protein n=1 Tax=Pseudocercospora fuligena TaxID=685502 RepID=A0A8H6RIS3_9PEZI|nr:hypothetical protein HII31_07099 [Pseudocercospora fuligena]
MATATTPQAEMPTSFRFLDLPPELRNRVYDLASSSEIPVTLIDRSSRSLFDLIDSEKMDSYLFGDALRYEKTNHNRLALLRVSRAVRREAWSLPFANMILEFPRHDRIPEVLPKIDALVNEWRYKLQHVQHLEMQDMTSDFFLWTPAYRAYEEALTRPIDGWVENWRSFSCSDFTFRLTLKTLSKLRTYLYNVRSVTIKPSYDAEYAQTELIAQVLYNLADSKTRRTLERMFPMLEDIVVVNMFGAERYVKSKEGWWMRAYSKEEIPLRLTLPLWQSDDPDSGSSHMADQETGFTAAHPVTDLDPQSAVEQASHN